MIFKIGMFGMHTPLKALSAVALGTFLSQVASATSFDFTNHRSANNDLSLDVLSDNSLITATLTAPGGLLGATRKHGIGVNYNWLPVPSRGLQIGEVLRIDFSQSVDIGSLTMRKWGRHDQVTLGYGTGLEMILDHDTPWAGSAETFTLNLTDIDFLTITGDTFLTKAYLAGLDDVQVSDIPVPAAAWLFGSALLGLVCIGRERKVA